MAQTQTKPRPSLLNGVFSVWLRHVLVWRTHFISALCTQFISPSLFLFAFGFGLGSVINKLNGINYLLFVIPGVIANAVFFTSSFEGSVQAFSRFYTQRTYAAILASPVTLMEILWGEVLVAASKATFAAATTLCVAFAVGGVGSPIGGLLMLPVVFLCALCFCACALFAMSCARGFEFFNYFFALWVTPAFLFCGVFFSIDRYPDWVQHLVYLLPMTHMIEVIRPLMVGLPMDPLMITMHLVYVAALGILALTAAHHKLQKRLMDK